MSFAGIYQYAVYPWFMTLLFAVAGVAAYHTLQNGTAKKIYFYCNRSGLFYLDVVKGIDDRRSEYDDTEERRQLESAAKMLFG